MIASFGKPSILKYIVTRGSFKRSRPLAFVPAHRLRQFVRHTKGKRFLLAVNVTIRGVLDGDAIDENCHVHPGTGLVYWSLDREGDSC